MEKSHIGRYGFLIALVVMMNAGMVWAQSNDTATADGPLREEMIAYIKDTSAGCSTFMRSEYRYSEDVNEQRPSINGVMVVSGRFRKPFSRPSSTQTRPGQLRSQLNIPMPGHQDC